MNLHNEIMNIQMDEADLKANLPKASFAAYKVGHRDARHAAAELALKAEARIKELEEALKNLHLASGPVSNCAYNVGQQHEDWENISQHISVLDKVRMEALKVYQDKNK